MVKINRHELKMSDYAVKVWGYSPVAPIPRDSEPTNTNTATEDKKPSEEPMKGVVYDMSKPSYRSQYGTALCTSCKAVAHNYDETTCRYYKPAKYRATCYWLRFGFMCDLMLDANQKPLND